MYENMYSVNSGRESGAFLENEREAEIVKHRKTKRFRLVALDEGGARGITNPRLVCRIEGECHEPPDWAIAQYGHQWWVPENAPLKIVKSE